MKLTNGQFSLPEIDFQEGKTMSHETLWSELVLMVQGIDAQEIKHRKRWVPKKRNLGKRSEEK
jgi:transposase